MFCLDLSEMRLERDEGEGSIQGGRKETDRGGWNIRNGVKWCAEVRKSQLVWVKLRNNVRWGGGERPV